MRAKKQARSAARTFRKLNRATQAHGPSGVDYSVIPFTLAEENARLRHRLPQRQFVERFVCKASPNIVGPCLPFIRPLTSIPPYIVRERVEQFRAAIIAGNGQTLDACVGMYGHAWIRFVTAC